MRLCVANSRNNLKKKGVNGQIVIDNVILNVVVPIKSQGSL